MNLRNSTVRVRTLSFFSLLLLGSTLWARVDYTGVIFEKGSGRTKKLMTVERQIEDKNPEIIEAKLVYSDLAGASIFEEKASLKGSALVKVEIEQKQTQQKGTIERAGDDILFSLTQADGTVKKAKEKFDGSLVVPANFTLWVRDNWERLIKGDTVEMRFGVWDRAETVGFKLFKIGEETLDGQKVFLFKMKASSFIIAALVDPLVFKYADKAERLVGFEGRVAPKKAKSGGGWADLDAEVLYSQVK